MDLSKLPKMSKTPPPPANPEQLPPAVADAAPHVQAVAAPAPEPIEIGADIWFMTIIGLVLIFFGQNFARYELARLANRPYHTDVTWQEGDKAGQEVAYPDLISGIPGGTYYTDSCLLLLGVTLIADGVGRGLAATRLPGRRAILTITLALTLLTLLYNFIVSAKYLRVGSLPLVSSLGIAFGGYLAFSQWATLQAIRPAPVASSTAAGRTRA